MAFRRIRRAGHRSSRPFPVESTVLEEIFASMERPVPSCKLLDQCGGRYAYGFADVGELDDAEPALTVLVLGYEGLGFS